MCFMGIHEITEKISPILREYRIKKASIFGSVSRGEDTPKSDVDLLVEFDRDAKMGLYEYMDMKEKMEQSLHRKVDVVAEDRLNNMLRAYITPDLKIVYEG